MKALIVDLRWNPGGLLDEAVEVCGKFLPRGQLVVHHRRTRSQSEFRPACDGRGDEFASKDGSPKPMVVLANLAARARRKSSPAVCRICTVRSFSARRLSAKARCKAFFPLDDGSALKLTTAKYYTPSHKVIHQHGITPDIEVPMTEEQEAALVLKRTLGGLESLNATNRVSIRKRP